MGQQQLLLVILVTIIVGIAIVVAINTMGQAFSDSKKNAMRQDMVMILNDAQLYYRKPASLGGGGNSFDGISKENIKSIDPKNENGIYEISGGGDSVTVDATSRNNEITLSVSASVTSGSVEISWSDSN